MAGVFAAPVARLEGGERLLAGLGVDRAGDVRQGCGDGVAVLLGDEIEAVAQQMDNAGLHHGALKHGR
jgi:hypothetical protein